MHIRIGTRKSKLAIAQAHEVAQKIGQLGHTYEIVTILTTGDKIKDKNLYDIGGKALFLKEIEEALLQNHIDIAVHSFKDVPAYIPPELHIAAVLERKSPYDVLISFKGSRIIDLPENAKIGTSSVRRKAQLLHLRPDLQILNCRGNITLRVEKFMLNQYDGIILAASGLEKLNIFDHSYCNIIPETQMLPAVAQGIIAIEIRKTDLNFLEICKEINHVATWELLKAERGFLEGMNADCQTPIAALAKQSGQQVEGQFLLASIDGKHMYTHREIFDIENGYDVGVKAANIIVQNSRSHKI
jgi:hydroxymethylbilane synthase